MRVLHYNVYCGQNCKEEPSLEKLKPLGAWLQTAQADVVAFTECNNWNLVGAEAIAGMFGFPHFELHELEKGYHIMLLSRHPIETFDDSVDGDPFHHGLLHVKVAGVHILELHMSPNNSTQRQAEAALISNIVKGGTGSVGAGEPLVVLGDFNNLSPVDSQRHVDQGIAEHMRKGATRGAKLVRRHMKEGNPANGLDYEPIQTLLDAGLEDVYPEHEEGKLPWTYPTRLREDQEDDPRLRIDYVLVNGACRAQMACASHVLTGGVLDTMSDHFPVIVDLLPK